MTPDELRAQAVEFLCCLVNREDEGGPEATPENYLFVRRDFAKACLDNVRVLDLSPLGVQCYKYCQENLRTMLPCPEGGELK